MKPESFIRELLMILPESGKRFLRGFFADRGNLRIRATANAPGGVVGTAGGAWGLFQ